MVAFHECCIYLATIKNFQVKSTSAPLQLYFALESCYMSIIDQWYSIGQDEGVEVKIKNILMNHGRNQDMSMSNRVILRTPTWEQAKTEMT